MIGVRLIQIIEQDGEAEVQLVRSSLGKLTVIRNETQEDVADIFPDILPVDADVIAARWEIATGMRCQVVIWKPQEVSRGGVNLDETN